MMHDETIPMDAPSHARFLAMAERNVRTLEGLIMARLSDDEAIEPAKTQQPVSLHNLVSAVRREFRSEAQRREITIVMESVSTQTHLDAGSAELILFVLLEASLREGVQGEQISIEFEQVGNDLAKVHLECQPARTPVADRGNVRRLQELANQLGM